MGEKQKKFKEDRSVAMKPEFLEDKISALPDCLIHHIQSFLWMKDIVKTSILSRRWRKVWASTPVLRFWRYEASNNSELARVITSSLMLYEGPKIKEFNVFFDHGEVDTRIIDLWLHFLVRHDVEVLRMTFPCDFYSRDLEGVMGKCYVTPQCLFTCHSLKVLDLEYCDLNAHSSFRLRLLKALRLFSVNFKSLDTSGCPLLENLSLVRCNKTSDMDIHCPNERLKAMLIRDDSMVVGREFGLSIYAPKLLTVSFAGCIRSKYDIKDLSSLINADFAVMLRQHNNVDEVLTLLKLFGNLSHVRTLKLCQWCMKALSYGEMKGWKAHFYFATNLTVKTSLNRSDLPGLVCLLRGSRHLQKLEMHVCHQDIQPDMWGLLGNVDEITCWKSLGFELSARIHLKTVKIINLLLGVHYSCLPTQIPEDVPGLWKGGVYYSCLPTQISEDVPELWKGGIKLVEMFLSCCKDLDKLEIVDPFGYHSFKSEWLPILTKKLLVFPRASVNAKIYLS